MAKFDVTVVRIGSLSIEADTAEEAMRLSEGYGNDDVVWADWFEATDAQRAPTKHKPHLDSSRWGFLVGIWARCYPECSQSSPPP